MSEQRFACTACGLCCSGLVPLTTREAVSMANRFPLAITITPVKAGTRGQSVVERIGVSVVLPPKKRFWLLVTPVAFIPPSMTCPELGPDNLCGIHDHKPIRCRTMPFYAYKDEDHQLDMLSPRRGWECNTTETAPVVYRDRKIVDRADFETEHQALVDQAAELKRYAELLLKHSPVMLARIAKASQSSPTGRVVVSFVSLLKYDKSYDLADFAVKQTPVLETWERNTLGQAKATEYNTYYREALTDLRRYVR
jgi:Fe-S-cluster containining protein